MLRLSELKLPLDHSEDDLSAAVITRLRLRPGELRGHRVVKRSVDARCNQAIALVYSLDLELVASAEKRLLARTKADPQLRHAPDEGYRFVLPPVGAADPMLHSGGLDRPVVVGAGPCGYFAALVLAQMGFRPLLLERGPCVKQRTADTFGFWKAQRPFNPESNVQFGEGGAGTFSDGKLYSQVSESRQYVRKVLEELVAAGANPEILSRHRPHIGTFKLATVVRGLRARVLALGGDVRFGCRVEALDLEADSRRVRGVVLAGGEQIPAAHVVLAIGHSARDTFAQLHRQQVEMQPKPFAMGLRIEHPQPLIDRARHGAAAGHPRLGAAEYKLVHHCQGPGLEGRHVYSFCMCPGGLVVGAASEPGGVVTNGMSQHSRNERNANSALVVNVNLEDLNPFAEAPGDPLAGVAFQRHWERLAFACGGGDFRAPVQTAADFLAAGMASHPEEGSTTQPSYQPGVEPGRLDTCLPPFVVEALREALPAFAQIIPGFLSGDAVLTGVETRTSSPVRMTRNAQTLQSTNTPGLFPGGEGAGYAGGIMSAAIDGIKLAEAVALRICSS